MTICTYLKCQALVKFVYPTVTAQLMQLMRINQYQHIVKQCV